MEKDRSMIPQDFSRLSFSSTLKGKLPKQLVVCPEEITLPSFSVIVGKVWDVYVTNVVLSGLWISRMNTDNTSLFFSWMVCLCDLVYITDAFARSTKRVFLSAITMDPELLYGHASASSILELFATMLTFLTFVPYHFLVIVNMDMSYVYVVVCVLRVARLWRSGRLNVVSKVSRTERNQHLRTSQQSKVKLHVVETGHRLQGGKGSQSSQNQDI